MIRMLRLHRLLQMLRIGLQVEGGRSSRPTKHVLYGSKFQGVMLSVQHCPPKNNPCLLRLLHLALSPVVYLGTLGCTEEVWLG